MPVAKSILFFVVVLVIVLFALSNAHHIPLRLIAGDPFNVRLIYLVLFSYLAGVLTATYLFVLLKINARRKRRRQQAEEEDDTERIE